MSFFWSDKPLKEGVHSRELGQKLAELVQVHVTRIDRGSLELEWKELRTARLDDLLHSVRIARFPDIPDLRTHWGSPDADWVTSQAGLVRELVARKDKKLHEYRSVCSEVWLLLIAEGNSLSRMVNVDKLSREVLESSFDRIYLLDFSRHGLYQLPVRLR